jgi:hypothetical protein
VCDADLLVVWFPTFWRIMVPSSSGSGSTRWGIFYFVDEGSMILQNPGTYTPKNTSSYTRKIESSIKSLWEPQTLQITKMFSPKLTMTILKWEVHYYMNGHSYWRFDFNNWLPFSDRDISVSVFNISLQCLGTVMSSTEILQSIKRK